MVIPFTGAWYSMSRTTLSRNSALVVKLDMAIIPQGTAVFDKTITVRNENGLRVFSNRCTHLGCKIDKVAGKELVCPCHGSRFDAATGQVISGPAGEDLKELNYRIDKEKMVIELEP